MSQPAPIDQLFHQMCTVGASDLHLCVGAPPIVRKDGRADTLEVSPAVKPIHMVLRQCSTEEQNH